MSVDTDRNRERSLAISLEDGYMLFAGWMRRDGKPSLRHAVGDEEELIFDADEEVVCGRSMPLVTVCGRVVPDDAQLEAMLVKTAHEMEPGVDRCRRCQITMLALRSIGTRSANFYCYPTDCMLCKERLLNPGRFA